MANFTTKAIATIISVSGLAVGAGFGVKHLTKQPTIEAPSIISKLSEKKDQSLTPNTEKGTVYAWFAEDGVELLGEAEGDDISWEHKWEKFKKEYESSGLKTNWASLDNKKEQEEAPDEFKALCKEQTQKTISSKMEKIYKEIKDYCTKLKISQRMR
ncbi:hypothetical protein A6V39_03350 [Candidatus Mycoplasma haematobovis]|uniref:Uncharacterized protein n=1 Tax=Candidatus Mycoplasma haematobovis TaxID=432608 RepID=A0A1A9QD34_9MOLU|nr:hypothetical protein [Candidatus Mycoplasma haematobovis]OAL09921.1 hypothetical protein A6V39_03350 [Candidatus Mycoplasma haematobovis]